MNTFKRLLFFFVLGLLTFSVVVIPFATQSENRLFAIDANSGQVMWTHPLPRYKDGAAGSLAMAPDRVFMQTSQKTSTIGAGDRVRWMMTMLDASTGKQKWKFQTHENSSFWDWNVPLYTSPDSVYTSLDNGDDRLLAFDAKTGKKRWEIPQNWNQSGLSFGISINQNSIGALQQGDRFIYLTPNEVGKTQLRAIDAKTAQPLWQATLPDLEFSEVASSLTMDNWERSDLQANDRSVFFLDSDRVIHTYDIATGNLQFTIAADQKVGGIALGEPALYRLSAHNVERGKPEAGVMYKIQAFDLTTGEENWTRQSSQLSGQQKCQQGERGFETLRANANGIYVICRDAAGTWLAQLRSSDGHLEWIQQIRSYSISELTIRTHENAVFSVEPDDVSSIEKIVARSAQNGAEQWSFPGKPSTATYVSNPVVAGDRVFVVVSAPRWRYLSAFT